MTSSAHPRRALLASVLATLAAPAALAQAPGGQAGPTLQRNRPPLQLLVRRRRNVGTMAIDDPVLVSYRKAVLAMRALPASDKRNWENQARIHLDHCPHGNWYFLPWHRAYLLAFERICQQMSGDPGFRLPYWNWTVDRVLPAAFTVAQVGNDPNPLRHTRGPNAGNPLPDNIVGTDVIEDILDETTFTVFASGKPPGQNSTAASFQRANGATGPLEGTPHNSVHGRLGGDMGTYMSPRDPIFWLHHCNIDRLWDSWRRRGNADTADPHWRDFRFGGQFVRPDGTTAYEPQCKDLMSVRALGYEYVPQLVVGRFPTDRLRALGVLRQVEPSRLVTTQATPAASAAASGAQAFRFTLPAPALSGVQRAARPPLAAA
ncbi:tyrosinase family protein, partial [Roseomonas rosulenta]|uniref:tyrosinase family protein n=1 Tax=Roseomonas rosulenta TaxID=2748667 RepID=UPI0018DF25C4